MRVSLYCFLSDWRKTRSSGRGSVGTSCTIGTEVTHAGCNWMAALEEYLASADVGGRGSSTKHQFRMAWEERGRWCGAAAT